MLVLGDSLSAGFGLAPGDASTAELLRRAEGGVFIQTLHGLHSGVNPVSGDFSVGAEGDPGEKALAYAAEVDTATPDDVTVDATALSMVTAALDSLEASRRTRLQASATFDALFVDLATRVADPDAQAASAHAYRYALWRTRAAMLAYQARYLGTSAPRRYTVPVTMSVHQLAALPEVFGDIARARELLDANAILDPCEVPAGTVLLVVD